MSNRKWLVGFCLILLPLVACISPSGTAPSPSSLEVQQNNVYLASGSGNYVTPPPGRQPINNGDRVRTDEQGIGWLSLNCADILIFWESNLQLQEVHAGNFAASGSQLFSSTCAEIKVNSGDNPPEAVIATRGTVFLAAYDPGKHITLLWTIIGRTGATLTNVLPNGPLDRSVSVPEGQWSVTRDRQPPDDPAHPVAEMGPIIDEMNLRGVYDLIVQIMTTQGFGPSAVGPQSIATIVAPTRTPTPTATPTFTNTPTETFTPTRLPTGTRTRLPTVPPTRPPTSTRTLIPTPLPTPTATRTATSRPTPTSTSTRTVTPTTTPFISFRADRTQITQGESTILRWDVDNVRAVYFEGQGVSGHDSREVQPPQTQTYTLRVVPSSGADEFRQVTITVLPAPPGGIQGAVYRAADALPVAAFVQLSNGQSLQTPSGSYTFSNIAPGTYGVTASAPGYFDETRSVTVFPGQTAYLNLPLRKAPVASGSHVVLGRTGEIWPRCFDFDSGNLDYTCSVGHDIRWEYSEGHDIYSGSPAEVAFASPPAMSYESCMDIMGSFVEVSVGDYVCVYTTDGQIAEMHITDISGSILIFDWVRY